MSGGAELNLPSMGTVEYRQDFLGDQVPDEFHLSLVGNGRVVPSSLFMVGGWLELSCHGVQSVARCRLGEDIDDSPVHHLNFAAKKNARAEARIVLNGVDDFDVTVGFTGHEDPFRVGGAWLYRSKTKSWWFQVIDRGIESKIYTDFCHVPGQPFCLGVSTSENEVVGYVERCERAAILSNIPTDFGMPFEFQLWNGSVPGGGWSSPTMWVDYLLIHQDR